MELSLYITLHYSYQSYKKYLSPCPKVLFSEIIMKRNEKGQFSSDNPKPFRMRLTKEEKNMVDAKRIMDQIENNEKDKERLRYQTEGIIKKEYVLKRIDELNEATKQLMSLLDEEDKKKVEFRNSIFK